MLTASGLLCLDSGSASIEGPGLCGRVLLWYLRRPRQLLLDVTSRLWSISWLRHQMFYPYVTISAAQTRNSDDLCHAMSPFSLSFFIFGHAKNLGICEPSKVHPLKRRKRRSIWRSLWIGTTFVLHCDAVGLQMLLWRMQTWNETQPISLQHGS